MTSIASIGNCTFQFEQLALAECKKADDCAVVIDVLRAFTTAAVAFDKGAEKIILVDTIERAREINQLYHETLLMGEEGGRKPEGFHFSNSPFELANTSIDLKGKTLIQRTSAGTQGVVNSTNAKRILTGSFAVADATIAHIHKLDPKKVSFVITGTTSGDQEDVALAKYLQAKIEDPSVRPDAFIQEVMESKHAQSFLSGRFPHFPKEDLELACKVDAYNFAMEVFREGDLHVMRKIMYAKV